MSIIELSEVLGNLGEFAGAFGVVATLIYLAIQVRHSRNAMEENARLAQGAVLATTFTHFSNFRRHIIDNADVARIWREGCGGGELAEDDRTRFDQLGDEFIFGFNSVFAQAVAAGDKDMAKAMPQSLAGFVHANPGIHVIWERMREVLATDPSSKFVELVDASVATFTGQEEVSNNHLG